MDRKAKIAAAVAAFIAGVTALVWVLVEALEGPDTPDGGVATAPDGAVTVPDDGKPTAVVTLLAHPSVIGRPVTVSFGLPLPPGMLATVTDGVAVVTPQGEVPVAVVSLGGWARRPPNVALCPRDRGTTGTGVRSVLVQFTYTFDTPSTQVAVKVGRKPTRTMTAVPVPSTYRTVDDGNLYTAADDIQEPQVMAAIDAGWLQCSGVVPYTGAMDTHPVLAATETGVQNFFYTTINDFRNNYTDPPNSRPVEKTYWFNLANVTDEAWLYDRPQTYFANYVYTGNPDMLREGIRAVQHYRKLLYSPAECAAATITNKAWCVGFFKIKNANINATWKDSKYSYGEALATYYWLTGDAGALEPLKWAYAANMTAEPVGFTTWKYNTERHTAFSLSTLASAYEVWMQPQELTRLTNAVMAIKKLQDTPTSEGTVNGCINSNFEGSGKIGFSPWMNSLLADALARVYADTSLDVIPGMLVQLAQCDLRRGMAYTTQIQSKRMLIPFYGGASVGPVADLDPNPWAGIEHAIDVAWVTALGAMFETNDTSKQELLAATRDLVLAHEWTLAYWTRDTAGRPKYRVSPQRKYAWWNKNAPRGIAWVLSHGQ